MHLLPAILALAISRPQTGPMSFESAFQLAESKDPDQTKIGAFRKWFGEENLVKGQNPHGDDLRFLFALQSSAAQVRAVSEDGTWSLVLHKIGAKTFAAATTLPEMSGFAWHYEADGQRMGGGQLEAYTYPPETKEQPGVPKGTLTQQPALKCTTYPGTSRDWWIYKPKAYDETKPACLLVVQDGQWSRWYWPTVLDNMIATKQMPVTIAVFLTPGTIKNDLDNRSVEYDTVSNRYVTMLDKEVLPMMFAKFNLRKDAAAHMITGLSSGGICSFNAAWQRPDLFGKVLSWIGSFTNLQGGPTGVAGGNTFPAIIRDLRGWDRKGAPKPIRVFLQDGANDIDNKAGNWPLSNQEMASALAYGGYDFKFVRGNGFHSDMHGRALLPVALRWLWRDEKTN